MKYSTIERALFKITNGGQSSSLDLSQFMAFIDEIQGNVKYEEIDIDSVVKDQQKDTKNSDRDNSIRAEGDSPSSKKNAKVVEPATLTLGLQSSKVSI